MPELIRVVINGQSYEAEKGEYILEVARRNNILIPTLCHHAALSGLGCCRVCVVEVIEGGWSKVVVSCVYPIARECEILTESDKIVRIRRTILSMLRDRAPISGRLAELCDFYKVPENERFTVLKDEKCILCGLCVQSCSSVGSGAISSVGRGIEKKVATPYCEPSKDCIGCGSCAAVCPTGAIECTEHGNTRTIWGKEFELLCCTVCGKAFATAEELARAGAVDGVCGTCRQMKIGGVMAQSYGIR